MTLMSKYLNNTYHVLLKQSRMYGGVLLFQKSAYIPNRIWKITFFHSRGVVTTVTEQITSNQTSGQLPLWSLGYRTVCNNSQWVYPWFIFNVQYELNLFILKGFFLILCLINYKFVNRNTFQILVNCLTDWGCNWLSDSL